LAQCGSRGDRPSRGWHTYASILIAAGVNAKAITQYLGHSSIEVTFDLYDHLMPGNEAEAAGLIDGYLERASGERLRAITD
jgi:integrase